MVMVVGDVDNAKRESDAVLIDRNDRDKSALTAHRRRLIVIGGSHGWSQECYGTNTSR